jgi:hypothetical protein
MRTNGLLAHHLNDSRCGIRRARLFLGSLVEKAAYMSTICATLGLG